MSPLGRMAVWAGGLGLVLLAYQSVWDPAMWVYNDRSLVHPLTIAASPRWLERATWAMTATPEHARLLNLLLHVCNAVLIGLLVRRLGLAEWVAAVVALAWTLHPLNVESVAYAAGRSELVAATGVLIAVLAAVANGRGWGVWAVIGVGLGLAAKESAVVAFGLVPLIRLATGHRWCLTAVVSGTAVCAGVVWYGGPRAIVNVELYSASVTMSQWVLIQATATVRLLWLSVLPFGQTIDFDYDLVPTSLRALSVFALMACAAVTWHLRRAAPLVALGLAWTLIAVAPRLIVQTPRSYLNEHQFYVPLIGLVFVAAYWLAACARWCATPGEIHGLMGDWRTHHPSAHL